MLAVVVDDFDMGVTHVIRGVDHLNNAARQLQIIEAMGWPVPVYGHVPLIHGADGAKLSKRHGALAVEAYRDMGYLPEAMRNYLLRLGWSHGDDEIIPTQKAIELFTLEAIGRSAARFDMKKLDSIDAHYMRAMSDGALADEAMAFAQRMHPGRVFDTAHRARLVAAMPFLKPRAKTLAELLEKADFLFTSGPPAPDKAAAHALNPAARALLLKLEKALDDDPWDAPSLEARTRRFAEQEGLALSDMAQPLRAALTGRTASPPVFDVLAVLGREEALTRIRAQGD
jgi:glutamyl-tRNA synthetase